MTDHPLPPNRVWLGQAMSEPAFDDTGTSVFYLRTADGRRSIVRQQLASGFTEIITAEPVPGGSVGYGGGAFAVHANMLVYAASGQLIALHLATGAQKSITPKYEGTAAPALSPCGRFVAFVVEHDGHAVVLLTETSGANLPLKLSSGPAFAANPTFSPDGARIAWMEWAAERMPWDESCLKIVQLAQPTTNATSALELLPLSVNALEAPNISFANPQWSPDGRYFAYTSDESGWRSLYLADANAEDGTKIDTGRGEIGQPDWIQGLFAMRWGRNSIYTVRRYRAEAQLLRIQLPERSVEVLDSAWTTFSDLAVHPAEPDLLAYIASTPVQPSTLVTRTDSDEIVRAGTSVGLLAPQHLARSAIITWPTQDGSEVYGVFHRATSGAGPRPLLVWIHGGPTSEIANGWNAQAQYFATRGWHYLSVNHRGGTGNGRAYQDLLNGTWGVFDVQDARSGAEQLIAQGLVDPTRVAIAGGSAGGYTTLMALVRDPDFWTAGVSLYGIGNLYDLRLGSHRFEARYEDSLIGPLPETAARWVERSALTHVANVKAPLLLFHGKEDKAVPYEQSVEFAQAVKANRRIAELVLYDDEGHGFRKEYNRRDQLEKMTAFLEKYVINLQGRR